MTAADHLNYRLFSDPQAEAMKKFGVAYQVDDTTFMNYKQKFNGDLEALQDRTTTFCQSRQCSFSIVPAKLFLFMPIQITKCG